MFHDLFSSKSKSKASKPTPIALSTRVRLARNISRYPFPGRAESDQKKKVLKLCINALNGVDEMKNGTVVEVDDLSELDRQILVEKHLISPELSQADESGGLFLSNDRSCSVMVNEEDHLRIQVLGNGLDFSSVWEIRKTLGRRGRIRITIAPRFKCNCEGPLRSPTTRAILAASSVGTIEFPPIHNQ